MDRFFKAQWLCAALIAASANTAYASTAECQSAQEAAAQDAASQAAHGDTAAKLRSAVFARDDSAFDSALGELVGKTDDGSRDSLEQALAGAAWMGNMHAVSALLSVNVDPNATTPITASPPIVLAAECGHIEALAALVAKGANVTAGSVSDRRDDVPRGALEAALVGAQPMTAAWLLEHGYDACQAGERARIASLLARLNLNATFPTSLKVRLSCQANAR